VAGRSPVVQRRRLGLELRRLREETGLTIEQVAVSLEVSDSKISRIETAQVGATPRDVRDMLALYGVTGEHRDWLIHVSREARQRAWWQRFGNTPESNVVGREAAASSVRSYAPLLVPGLLQTRPYARAVLSAILTDLAEIEQRLEMRMARQSLLKQEDPPRISTVIDEAALRRVVGGATVMRDQLEYLVEAAAIPTVTIQVLPFSAGEHPGMDGQFDLYGYEDVLDPDIVYLENAISDLVGMTLNDSTDVIRRYAGIFERVQAKALDPSESGDFIASLATVLS